MKRDDLSDLAAFAAVAEEMSFTRAASKMGTSPSALSHTLRSLEGRLGVRLLSRTTRSVATTDAGERLLQTLRPALADIALELTALNTLRDKPAGTVRVTASKHAATSVLWPVLPAFLEAYPDIGVEISVDAGLTDIVTARFDAGLRFGEKVAKDMIAVLVGPPIRSAVVAAPAYLARHPAPRTPRELADHRCINHRLPTSGAISAWEFEIEGRTLQVKVEGPLVVNDSDLTIAAALAGQGLAYLFEDQIAAYVSEGRLMSVLEDWCWSAPGYYLYYSSRRYTPPALTALIETLRRREARARTGL